MATIDFPSNPSIGSLYSFGDYRYRYDGVKWVGLSNSDVSIQQQFADHEAKPNAHPISGVSGLQSALDSKFSPANKPTATDVGAAPAIREILYNGGSTGTNKLSITLQSGLYSIVGYVGDGGDFRGTFLLEVDHSTGATIFKSTSFDSSWKGYTYNHNTNEITGQGNSSTLTIFMLRKLY